MRGGFRPGAGRPPGSKDGAKRCRRVQYAQNEHVESVVSEPEAQAVTNYSGQDWLRLVINDPLADPVRRDRAAMVLANIESRAVEALGKKAAADRVAQDCDKGTKWEKLLRRTPAMEWDQLVSEPLPDD
jgi:hypothetical protein